MAVENILNAIFEMMSDAVYAKDLHGCYLMINQAGANLLQSPVDDIIGKDDTAFFSAESVAEIMARDREVIATGEIATFEEVLTAGGVCRSYTTTKSVYRDEAGKISGVLGISREITALKQEEEKQILRNQEAQAMMETQKELNYMKDLFLSIASHELRTPLTSLKGYAQMLEHQIARSKEDHLPPETLKDLTKKNEKAVGIILHQVERMAKLIDQLLDFSRVQSKQLELKYTRNLDLVYLIRRSVEQQTIIHNQHKLKFKCDYPSIVITGDETRLEQILDNLVSNASKYSQPGTQIEIGIACDAVEVIVWVRDEGPGIPEDQQKNIFNSFYRAQLKDNDHIEGLGLGLYIVHEIVKRHQGRMWLESKPEVGSTFYFALPLAPG